MEILYHRLINSDLRIALEYYESHGGTKLADRFFEEVEASIDRVVKNPCAFHFAEGNFRRATLRTFPYHFLFEVTGAKIRFLVLRHDKRNPKFGLTRRL